MKIKNNDFIELDFVGKVKETNEIFDTTMKEEAKKANLVQEKSEDKFKPLGICVGQGMVVKGFDKALEGKEAGEGYEIELKPEDAFGKRDSKLVRILSLSEFRKRGIEPFAGMMLTLDSFLVRIASVTSGRVIVDFNNPLSGKNISYRFTIRKIVEDSKEKLLILSRLLVGIEPEIKIEEKKAIVEFPFKLPEQIEAEFKKKVKEITGIEVEAKEAKKPEKKEEQNGKIEPERPYNE